VISMIRLRQFVNDTNQKSFRNFFHFFSKKSKILITWYIFAPFTFSTQCDKLHMCHMFFGAPIPLNRK